MRKIPAVKSVMTPFPYSVSIDAPIEVARQFMVRHKIRHIPVVEEDRLVGVVTDRDIKLILGPDFDYPPAKELTVRDVVVPESYVVDLEERLDTVLLHMADNRIGSVLVTRKGKLAGLFTVTDACRCYGELLRDLVSTERGDDIA